MEAGVCSVCGEHNPPGTEFCVVCQNYLGWDKSVLAPPQTGGPQTGGPQSGGPQAGGPQSGSPQTGAPQTGGRPQPADDDQAMLRTQMFARVPVDPSRPGQVPSSSKAAEPLLAPDRFRISIADPTVTLAPTGAMAELQLRVFNISIRVDGYLAELAPGAPEWLSVDSTPVELLPGTDDLLRARFQVRSARLTPAQQLSVRLRIRAMNEPAVYVELPVTVTVSVVDAPLQLRAEPRLLRVQDRPDGTFTLTVDNTQCNRPVRVELAGCDPELAVRFEFDPAIVEVGPVAIAPVRVTVTAEPARRRPGSVPTAHGLRPRRRTDRRDGRDLLSEHQRPGRGPGRRPSARTGDDQGPGQSGRAGPADLTTGAARTGRICS